jgi:hypothetical protein
MLYCACSSDSLALREKKAKRKHTSLKYLLLNYIVWISDHFSIPLETVDTNFIWYSDVRYLHPFCTHLSIGCPILRDPEKSTYSPACTYRFNKGFFFFEIWGLPFMIYVTKL